MYRPQRELVGIPKGTSRVKNYGSPRSWVHANGLIRLRSVLRASVPQTTTSLLQRCWQTATQGLKVAGSAGHRPMQACSEPPGQPDGLGGEGGEGGEGGVGDGGRGATPGHQCPLHLVSQLLWLEVQNAFAGQYAAAEHPFGPWQHRLPGGAGEGGAGGNLVVLPMAPNLMFMYFTKLFGYLLRVAPGSPVDGSHGPRSAPGPDAPTG